MAETGDVTRIERDHGCQTPGCPNDFSIVMTRVDDRETDLLCDGCAMAFWVAVLQRAHEDGLVQLGAPEPAPDGAPHQ